MNPNQKYLPDELLDFAFPPVYNSEIKVIGVGGGGCNAVNHMFAKGVQDVQFILCNTDAQALNDSLVPTKIQLGEKLTGGRGAGTNPEVGRKAAIESLPDILQLVEHATDMVFIAAGMGGGTGTGAAPVIAQALREKGILTVGIVTLPFSSEIGYRRKNAEKGLMELSDVVDALVVIDNDQLQVNYADYKLSEAFKKADEVLSVAAQSIVEIIKIHGKMNVDFNDVKTVMTQSKLAMMGTGYASGKNRAQEVVKNAIQSPLINYHEMKNAKRILLNILSGEDEILMGEYDSICKQVQEIANHSSDQFIIGSARDLSLNDQIKVTIIATGFEAPLLKESPSEMLPADQADTAIAHIHVKDGSGKDQVSENQVDTTSETEPEQKPAKKKSSKKESNKKLQQAKQFLINFFDDLEE